MPGDPTIDALLDRTREGDQSARSELFGAVHQELRGMAANIFGRGAHHTLQPTVLVNEAYLKMAGTTEWESRKHFLCVAAKAMRQVLADYVRAKNAEKRPDAQRRVTLIEKLDGDTPELEFEELHHALERLAAADERSAQVIELRVFGGMSVEEVADALDMSVRSVHRDWRAANAWLRAELG